MVQAEHITGLLQVHQEDIMVREVLIQEVHGQILHGVEIIQDLKVEFKAEQADQDQDIVDPVPDLEEEDSVNNKY